MIPAETQISWGFMRLCHLFSSNSLGLVGRNRYLHLPPALCWKTSSVQLVGRDLPLKYRCWWMPRYRAVWIYVGFAPLFCLPKYIKIFGVSKSMEIAECKLCMHLGRGCEEKHEVCCFSSTWEFVYSSQPSVRVAYFQFMPQRHRIAVCGLRSLARQLCVFVTKWHERYWNKWFFNLMCLLFEIWESFSSLFSGELFSFFLFRHQMNKEL